jgi:hypothetical protein
MASNKDKKLSLGSTNLYRVFGMTLTLTLSCWGLMTSSAQAKTWKLPQSYQGKVCITGFAKGNVSINWGGWSHTFNGMQIREEAAFNHKSGVDAGTAFPILMGQAAGRALSEADKLVSRVQGYSLELNSYGSSNVISVSDNTATVRHRRCTSTYTVRR